MKAPVKQPSDATELPAETPRTAAGKPGPAAETPAKTPGQKEPSATPGERVVKQDPATGSGNPSLAAGRRSVPLVGTQPSSPVTRSPVPADVAVDTHRVQAGDTLSSLASLYYGGERYTQFLIDSNKQLADPNRLKIGEAVRIPPRPVDAASHRAEGVKSTVDPTAESKGRTYRVQPGDSFYKIAEQSLGDSSRWKELFELNKERVGGDPTRLQVGQDLVLPAK